MNKIKDFIESIVEGLADLLSPPPAPVPIPVRTRPHHRPRR